MYLNGCWGGLQQTGGLPSCFFVAVLCTFGYVKGLDSDSVYYLTETCYGHVQAAEGRIEASTALTYDNNMNCVFTATATGGVGLILVLQRFEIEESTDGQCKFDNLTLHDGNSVASPIIPTAPLCGRRSGLYFLTSSTSVTVHFRTDSSGVDRGFSLLFTAYYQAPCRADQFLCGGGQCVGENVKCNGLNQCGDFSDETNCAEDSEEDSANDPVTQADPGVVSGVIIGATLFIILVILGAWRLYKWKQYKTFLKRIENEEVEKAGYNEISFRTVDSRAEYPLTNYYQNDG
ncbi:neuropilin and tolloid-like protein 2 [Lingula anatina]|uniref:Neuropilin and tolloid-like protein 2 n=1 Tax=Lingula anatina TaxID=7574 RepID=A0A1S3HYE4_LINAN|nr:neuropilin and tolloid-like protein 2 [Lingula anatina]|eukprot:XP_013391033.1 neuropilin and tolloid-like protein 2 [Lingula anatina]